MDIVSLMTGIKGPSGFGSSSTAEQVTEGIDATNLTAIVTGGASGLGFETGRVLALRKAHVIIAARNLEAANAARLRILEEDETARVNVLKLDLTSITSVRDFVRNFDALHLPLNILINNAGVSSCPFQTTEYGAEMQFSTNHLGHFLLTELLVEKMKETARSSGIQGRIVNVSSLAHIFTYKEGIRFDQINDPKRYNRFLAYAQSKFANILHVKELARRFEKEGVDVTANALHPGIVDTPIGKHTPFLWVFYKAFTSPFRKNVEQGAGTICYAAVHPQLKGVSGKYFSDCNEKEVIKRMDYDDLAKALWDFSEKLIASAQV